MTSKNEIENLIKRRDSLDERIKDEKLKLFENFTMEFLTMFDKDVSDVPKTKKGCREFIESILSEGDKVELHNEKREVSQISYQDSQSGETFGE